MQLQEPKGEDIAASVTLFNKTRSSSVYCKHLTDRCLELCIFPPLFKSPAQLHTAHITNHSKWVKVMGQEEQLYSSQ